MIRFLARIALAAAMIAVSARPAFAVTLTSGNFYSENLDLAVPNGLKMRVDRVYNSTASFNGIFGLRWSFQYEEYMELQDDGSVLIHEYGGGYPNRFVPVTAPLRSTAAICDELTAAAEKLGLFASAKEKADYRAWVVDHHESEFERFRRLGMVKSPYLGVGQEFRSRRFGNEELSSVPEGYQRTTETGLFEEFDLRGKLVRVWDANHNSIALRYDEQGRLAMMEDSGGNRFVFAFNAQGHVTSIEWGGRIARYEYDGSYLIKSSDGAGHTFVYSYDSQYPYYLTGIHYADGTDLKVSYYPVDAFSYIKEIIERDGTRESYQYDQSVADHYAVTITTTDPSKNVVVDKYETYYGHSTAGNSYEARMVESLNSDVTDTTYNADHRPLSITRNGVTTRFTYDDSGRVTLKQSVTQTIKLTYDPIVAKVSSVSTTTTADGKTTVVTFKYDDYGNVIDATDADGHEVAVAYDDIGRVSQLTAKTGEVMHLIWNPRSKLVQVVVDGVGTLDVVYKDSGDFLREESPQGDAVLRKIDAMYGIMTRIIKPPDVPLTF